MFDVPPYRWYFALISVSGVFAVTFSVIFAYVADITDEQERSTAYGLVKMDALFTICSFAYNQFENGPMDVFTVQRRVSFSGL